MSILAWLVLASFADTPEKDLSQLGRVSRFIDARDIPPTGQRPLNSFIITNDGKRVYQCNPGVGYANRLYTWEIDPWRVIDTYREIPAYQLGALYNPDTKQPFPAWPDFPRPHRDWSNTRQLNSFVVLGGALDTNRPFVWQHGFGSHGIKASALTWVDISKKGSDSAGILFFARKDYRFLGIDSERKLLVLYTEALPIRKPKLYAYKLSSSGPLETPVALPAHLRRLEKHGAIWRDSISHKWRWLATPTHEYDLHTGQAVVIPGNTRVRRLMSYLGEDLLVSESIVQRDPEGNAILDTHGNPLLDTTLYIWNRKAKQQICIGPYEIIGKSDNGNHAIFKDLRGGSQSMYFVSRK